MIVERFALGIAKSLNLLGEFAFSEGSKGTFKTNRREEKPINFGFDLTLDLSRNNAKFTRFYEAQRSKILVQRRVILLGL